MSTISTGLRGDNPSTFDQSPLMGHTEQAELEAWYESIETPLDDADLEEISDYEQSRLFAPMLENWSDQQLRDLIGLADWTGSNVLAIAARAEVSRRRSSQVA